MQFEHKWKCEVTDVNLSFVIPPAPPNKPESQRRQAEGEDAGGFQWMALFTGEPVAAGMLIVDPHRGRCQDGVGLGSWALSSSRKRSLQGVYVDVPMFVHIWCSIFFFLSL